jgi:hypothetical protein
MFKAERFGHRLESVSSTAQQGAEPAVIQRTKDNSTLERIRRANKRAIARLDSKKIRKSKHRFASTATNALFAFEKDKKKTSLTTPFGPVNLSKFPTKDPGPKITTVAKSYDNQSVGHKYSELAEELGDKEPQVASDLLGGISSDTAKLTAVTSGSQKNAAAKMLAISHISEERRFGGSAKMFRAILRMVKAGKISMKDAFTGTNPSFPMAKNPALMRRLINLEKKKLRKPPPKPKGFDDVASYMSDSSDEES